jgi:hypothetical protein
LHVSGLIAILVIGLIIEKLTNCAKEGAMEGTNLLIRKRLYWPAGALLVGIVVFVQPSWGLAEGDSISINTDEMAAGAPVAGQENAVSTTKDSPRRVGSRTPSESSDQSEGEAEEEEPRQEEPAEEEDRRDADDIDPRKNLIAQHDSSSKQYKKNCSECHSDIHSRQSMDPSVPSAHRVMFPYAAGKPGNDKQCGWCHQTVDLVQGTQREEKSTGSLRRHTDVRICTLCHGPFRGPGEQLYQGGLSPTDPDGPLLYHLTCAGCHGPLESSKVSGEDADDIRKKIDEDEGGMGPLSVLTTTEIEAIAAALAK